jgi:hexosaminidase
MSSPTIIASHPDALSTSPGTQNSGLALIPQPTQLRMGVGHFILDKTVALIADSPAAQDVIELLRASFHRLSGIELSEANAIANGHVIALYSDGDYAPESYRLEVSSQRIEIRASDSSGFFYGVQTLLQCIPFDAPESPTQWAIPCLTIEDAPRFSWRGLMLDSSRRYHAPSFMKRFIDLMAFHKFNRLHWHLIDDQGWRIEIDKYPELTTVGAWRTKTRVGLEDNATEAAYDGKPHGGSYSKAELHELVAYAQARGITIIPEVEMPGHATAALAAFPHLSCTGGPFEVSTRWGIHEEVFCAGNDAVFRLLEDVLEEVIEIFPSTFIHVGGDECRKTRWKTCPKCQQRMKDEGLADENELQSWFVQHFDKFLNARGRRLIGWDEILEGGLAQNAAVMSWRGEEAGIEAAMAGHDVVMAPHRKTYLDYYQSDNRSSEPLSIGGFLPLEKIYENGIIPEGLDAAHEHHVLGGQGQLWTEYMPRTDNVEYMAYPRACALSEILWSNPQPRDFTEFSARLRQHLRRLDRLDVNYRPLDAP